MEELDPRKVLDDLGIEYTERPNRLSIRCPFHHDTNPSSGFYLDTQLFHCYACELTLNLISFYAKAKEISEEQARRELRGEVKAQRVDRVKETRLRKQGEEVLLEMRKTWSEDYRNHARFGEVLDRILLLYHRGRMTEDQLERSWEKWYERAKRRTQDGTDVPRAPATDTDDRVEEGLEGVSGAQCGGSQ